MPELVSIQSAFLSSTPEAPAVELSEDFREFSQARTLEEVVRWTREVLSDPSYPTARAWARSGRVAVGCFPVYTPQEIPHALGLLPVSLHGGGENVEISHADAALGSFLCSISKSTLELALTHRLDAFRAFVFPYICDVSRNLEGIFSRLLPEVSTHMLHLPQNFESAASVPFLKAEYRRWVDKLETVSGARLTPDALAQSIEVFARQREALAALARLRVEEPWKIDLSEQYLVRRLGGLLPREVHTALVERVLSEVGERQRKRRDAVRLLVVGPFCEQPTLDLIEMIEEVGFYVVGDEFLMLSAWHDRPPPSADPLESLARAYVETPRDIGVRRAPGRKADAILRRVRATRAQAVLFLTAKFCEPALEDVVLYRRGLDREKIPYLHMEFEERSTAYEQTRLQLETFAESILFE